VTQQSQDEYDAITAHDESIGALRDMLKDESVDG
jgi:hypothetical protein